MALAMIEGAERDGLISPGDTVVEYTGGSTGPALALVCRAKGYRPLIVIADCFTEERFHLMRALGAELDVVKSVEGRPKSRRRTSRTWSPAPPSSRAARPLRDRPVQQPVHHPRPSGQPRPGDLGADRRPRDRVLPRDGHGELGDRRLRGAAASRRVHPGARARLVGGDQRRRTGAVPDPGLDRPGMPHWDAEKVDHVEPIGDDEAIAMTRRLAAERGSSPASPRARTSSAHTVSRIASAPTRSSSRSRSTPASSTRASARSATPSLNPRR